MPIIILIIIKKNNSQKRPWGFYAFYNGNKNGLSSTKTDMSRSLKGGVATHSVDKAHLSPHIFNTFSI